MCLVGPKNLESHYVHKVNNIRMRGNTSKLHLALSGLPKFKGVEQEDLGHRIINAPSMKYLELANSRYFMLGALMIRCPKSSCSTPLNFGNPLNAK